MSKAKGRVTVNSTLTVVPGAPVRPGKTYPLSLLDHAMGFHTLHIVFYYEYDRSNSSDLDRMRESLSENLSYYPPVTGRLRRGEDGNWEVKCTDAGVRVLKARVQATLDEWLKSADGFEERDLTVWEDFPDDPSIWSPFRIQMNDFEGGGLAIGLSCTHMMADPNCATLLLKSWTELYRGLSIENPPFFHAHALRGRATSTINPKSSKDCTAKSKAKPPSPLPVKMSTVTFRISDTMVKKLLSEVHAQCPAATPFDVLASLFWSRVLHVKAPPQKQTQTLSICIDFRKLMHASLPYGYFGNALHFSTVSSNTEEIEEGGLAYVVGLIRRHVSSLEEAEYWSAIDWFESQKEGKKFAPPFRMYGPELTCANLEHVFAYTAQFEEDKKPLHVSYHVGNVEGEGLILILPSPKEGLGRTVTVTLPENETAKLCEDSDILQLEPIMLVSGRRESQNLI